MTNQEQRMIDDLVDRIRKTPVTDKDVEAERHLQQTLATVPDALYILAQTVLVQQYGLTQAQAQLEALQNEVEQLRRDHSTSAAPQKSGSFLSRIFGAEDSTPPPPPPSQGYAPAAKQGPPTGSAGGYQPVNYAPTPQGYPPPPPYGAPGYGGGYAPAGYAQGSPGMFGGGGGGGFLRGALQTAAGVAAGAMVFQGMEDLFRGFGSHEGHGLGTMPGETVVNNYYGDEGQHGSGLEDRSLAGGDDGGFYNPSHDASREDLGGDSRGFADTSSDADSDLDNGNDDTSDSFTDDSASDDSSDFSSDQGGDDSNY